MISPGKGFTLALPHDSSHKSLLPPSKQSLVSCPRGLIREHKMFSQVSDSLTLKDFQCCSSRISNTLMVKPVVSHVQNAIWIIDLIVKGRPYDPLCVLVFSII